MEIFDYVSHGEFRTSWLAATSPTIFKKKFRKVDVESIEIFDVVQRINQLWCLEEDDDFSSKISLYYASQLLYGSVCIYQQQVQFLYEKSSLVICQGSYYIKNLSRRIPELENPRKKRKIELKNLIPFESDDDDKKIIPTQRQKAIITEANNEMITLRELDDTELPDKAGNQRFNDNASDIVSIKSNERDDVFDFVNLNVFSEMFYTGRKPRPKISTIYDLETTEMVPENQSCTKKVEVDSLEMSVVPPPPMDIEVENPAETKGDNDEIYNPPPPLKAKRIERRSINNQSFPVIDSDIYISDVKFLNQSLKYDNTLRAHDPFSDSTSIFHIRPAINLFVEPGNRMLAKTLRDKFEAKCVTSESDYDEELLLFLEPLKPTTVADAMILSQYEEEQVKQNVENSNIEIECNEQLDRELMPPPQQPIIVVDDENLNPKPKAIELPLTGLTQYIQIDEIDQILEEQAQNEKRLESLKVKTEKKSRRRQGIEKNFEGKEKEFVLDRLNQLWNDHVVPVDMDMLCSGISSRKMVSLMFYILLVLKAEQTIRLVKDVDSLKIYHIDKGDNKHTNL